MNGSGGSRQATLAMRGPPPPTPRATNIYCVNRGAAAPAAEHAIVFAVNALAAYIRYVSARKLRYATRISRMEVERRKLARVGTIQ